MAACSNLIQKFPIPYHMSSHAFNITLKELPQNKFSRTAYSQLLFLTSKRVSVFYQKCIS